MVPWGQAANQGAMEVEDGAVAAAVCIKPQPPEYIDFEGVRWARSMVAAGRDLVNGKWWIKSFGDRCEGMRKAQAAGAAPKPGRRLLSRQVLTDGDNPLFWASSKDLPMSLRNEVVGQMVAEGCPAGRLERLPNGEEVIFWFNVGPTADVAPPAERVFVTGARCPHQGVCLATGELREIEDLAGGQRPVIRCPRHNRLFDVSTGHGQGNDDALRSYKARFFREHERFYVAIGASPAALQHGPLSPPSMEAAAICAPPEDAAAQAQADAGADMEVDVVMEPEAKRFRHDDILVAAATPRHQAAATAVTPARILFRQGTL
eukprot:TRINITY_DN49194_c0_g1_i1.p1 TRINITY_DN49194_c0_g1~~TRINITY_DN49194_c0_g1_i1.p1  ORF type:complete len:318 (+),score=64.71 TRINITY_DN49194_c0_g1_i1:76-1029(+)